ncbi:MAG: 4-hydroxybenzoyl-CoA thioesterase [Sulfitobacter sp.]
MAFTYVQKVKFRHCDPAGIVFYPRFFEMMNDTVEAFFEQELDYPFAQMHDSGGIPTAQIATQFKRPSRLGDVLQITLSCTRLGRSSLDLMFEASCGTEPRFSATSTLVFITLNGTSTPWPDPVRSRLENHIEEARRGT